MGNSTGNTDKKSMTACQKDKIEEECWNMLGWKEKTTQQIKQAIQLKEINQKALVKKKED